MLKDIILSVCVLALLSLPFIAWEYRRKRQEVLGPINARITRLEKLVDLRERLVREEQAPVRDHTMIRSLRSQIDELEDE